MTKRRANYCPDCGAELDTRVFEARDRQFCPDCREFVFQTPTPTAQVVVVDGGEALLVERDHGRDSGKWTVPGGFLEVDEPAPVGAARELEEEAGLAVDPDALALVRTGFDMPGDPADGSVLSVCFAVERDTTHGSVRVGDEPAAAAFRDPDGLDAGETRSVDRRRVAAAFEQLESQGPR